MKTLSLLVLVSLFFSPALVGAIHKIEMSFEALVLKNGKTIGPGMIKSYDRSNGKVVVQANRQIVSYQLEMLPDETAEKIVAMVPSEEKDESREAKTEKVRTSNQSAKQNAERAKNSALQAKIGNDERKAREEEAQKQQVASLGKAKARSAALQKANHYFRYEYKPGSGSTVIIRQDIQMDEPEEVPGWANRYRLRGNIGLEFFDSRGRSFNSTTRNFEVLVQIDERGNAKAVDFSAL